MVKCCCVEETKGSRTIGISMICIKESRFLFKWLHLSLSFKVGSASSYYGNHSKRMGVIERF